MTKIENNQDVSGLELKLFEDLEDYQKREAAFISVGMEKPQEGSSLTLRVSEMVRIDPSQRSKDKIDEKLSYFDDIKEENIVITGVDYSGKVIAVYEIPVFGWKESFLQNMPGLLITEPEGKGTAYSVLTLLEPILESLAAAAKSAHLTHNVASKKRGLYSKHGYTDEGNLNITGEHAYSRQYIPQEHQLGTNQKRIVEDFVQKMIPRYNPKHTLITDIQLFNIDIQK